MFLTYVGESGSTGKGATDPSQPHLVYTGLLVHESQSISMNGEFSALCRRHFGAPLGEEGAPTQIRPVDVFQGLGYFAKWPPLKRYELIQDCLSIMIRRETPVVVSYINKNEFAEAKKAGESPEILLWDSPTESVVNKFLFALGMFMDELSMSKMSEDQIMDGTLPISNFALVIAQAGASIQSRFMTDFLRSDDGLDTTALMQNICFVEPRDSVGSQLSHLCAYFVRRWLQHPDQSHPYFDGLRENGVIQVIYPVSL